jgi:hypothetical protein
MNFECTKCKQPKPHSEFWKDNRKDSGIMGRCKDCKRNQAKSSRIRDIEKHREREKRRYWENKPSEQERHLKRKYGIDLNGYKKLLQTQEGLCAICKPPEPATKKFDVDHCHVTGVVRGLLCTSCNRMLGHSGDKEETLTAAAEYLRSSRKSRQSL